MLLPDSPMPDITGSDTSMPAKKLKLVSDVKLDPASGMWLSLNVLNVVISFSHIDRKDLCDSDQVLTDNPINFDQNLKKNSIEGLESVLLRTQHTAKISNGIQFVHSRGNHWITVSSIDTCEREMTVCDSLYASADDATLQIIRNRFCDNMKIQKQTNLWDRGLFAIANATALAFGTDSTAAKLDTEKMRNQFFEDNLVTFFPQE